MDIPATDLAKWGTPWAYVGNLNTAGLTSKTTVVTPAPSKIVTYNIGGQRSATTYGLVLTSIQIFAPADATPKTVTIYEWDGATAFEIMTVGSQVTYATNVSYEVWHPLKCGIQTTSTVTNGSVIQIQTTGQWLATNGVPTIRLEGFHTTDPSLWNAYISGRTLGSAITFS